MTRLVWLLVLPAAWHAAGCGCSDSDLRHRDGGRSDVQIAIDASPRDTCCTAPDAERDVGGDLGVDTGVSEDAALDARDVAIPDSSPIDSDVPDACLDACMDAGDADAGADAELDGGPDAGCRPGRIPCPGPDGVVRCIDPMWDDCNCGGCGSLCGNCTTGMCLGGCRADYEDRCIGVCDLPSDEEASHVCIAIYENDQHCGACFHACAPGEYCSGRTCFPRPED